MNWKIESHDVLPSTMDAADERGQQGAEAGLVILAAQQSSGRGRGGNQWIAPPGNLSCSILLRPSVPLRDIGHYSFIAAVALAETIDGFLKPGYVYRHKWPNDGLINDRKFAGILLETRPYPSGGYHLVLGLGVNLIAAPDDRLALREAVGTDFTPAAFLDRYLSKLDIVLENYARHGFKPVRQEWLANAKGLNQEITARLERETLNGRFNGIDADGRLLLGVADQGQRVISSAEVFFRKDM